MHPTAPATGSPPDNRLLFRFLFVAGAMYLAWFFVYQQWLEPDGRLDAALCGQITRASVGLLQAVGFDAAVAPTYGQLVLMSGEPSVVVYPACNGLVLYALFGGFVLAFPGPWRRKAWFIPAGIALIWILNVLRVAALAINHHYSHQTVDFNHHYTFNVVVYGCIFGLWMLWARRLALDNTPPLPMPPAPDALMAPPASRPASGRWVWVALLLLALLLLGFYEDPIVVFLTSIWQRALAALGLQRQAAAFQQGLNGSVVKRLLPAVATYAAVYLAISLLLLRVLLPEQWRLVWRLYAGALAVYMALVLLGKMGGDVVWAYRLSRQLLDFIVSPLPVAGLFVLMRTGLVAPSRA